MKQKILRKKIEAISMKKGDIIEIKNPFHNLSANNKLNLINNPDDIIKIKNHKISILPTNVNYQKASFIYNSTSSPKFEENNRKKKESFSSVAFINHNIINNKPVSKEICIPDMANR